VSNFDTHELMRLAHTITQGATGPVHFPTVLQNKFDIYHPGRQLDPNGDDIMKTCREMGIQLVGYSPFSAFPLALLPLQDPLADLVAKKRGLNETAGDVIMKWMVQQGKWK
jgi:diketogulonate reductase-like aldo/keto reductase